jgi:hypothetical protein
MLDKSFISKDVKAKSRYSAWLTLVSAIFFLIAMLYTTWRLGELTNENTYNARVIEKQEHQIAELNTNMDKAVHQQIGEVGGTAYKEHFQSTSKEIKQQISDEIKAQLALENSEAVQSVAHLDVDAASTGIAYLSKDGRAHIFMVGSALDVMNRNGKKCSLSDGDILELPSPPTPDATTADLIVLASKGEQECKISSAVTVQITDLEEMQNQMRELINQGLQELQEPQKPHP